MLGRVDAKYHIVDDLRARRDLIQLHTHQNDSVIQLHSQDFIRISQDIRSTSIRFGRLSAPLSTLVSQTLHATRPTLDTEAICFSSSIYARWVGYALQVSVPH